MRILKKSNQMAGRYNRGNFLKGKVKTEEKR